MNLKSLLTEHFCSAYQIDFTKDYKIETIKARDLMVSERIDLIAKYKYIEHKEKGFDMTFVKEVYENHIEAFSLGSFSEPGNNSKDSIEKYLSTFDYLINEIKENGIDQNVSVVPVGANNVTKYFIFSVFSTIFQ
jgi:hypothetical protein